MICRKNPSIIEFEIDVNMSHEEFIKKYVEGQHPYIDFKSFCGFHIIKSKDSFTIISRI